MKIIKLEKIIMGIFLLFINSIIAQNKIDKQKNEKDSIQSINLTTPSVDSAIYKGQVNMDDKNIIFNSVEINPMPEGGINQFRNEIVRKLLATLGDVKTTLLANVRIRFVVMEDGSLGDFEVLEDNSGTHYLSDKVIIILKSMPKWTPGYMNGRAVKVYFNFPIKFQITTK